MPSPGEVASKALTVAKPVQRHRTGELLDHYAARLSALLASVDRDALERVAERLALAFAGDHAVYVAGNGGSAATASHWVTDLLAGQARRRAFSLCDNAATLTAVANDHGFEQTFSAQLRPLLRAGDVVTVISVSGNSQDLLRAVRFAMQRGAATIGLLGSDGGQLRAACSECVVLRAPAREYGLVESGHSVLCDVLARRLSGSGAAPLAPVS